MSDYIFNYGRLRFFDKSGSEMMLSNDSSIVITSSYDDDRKMVARCVTDRDGSVYVSDVTEWGMMDTELFPADITPSDALSFEIRYSQSDASVYTAYSDVSIKEMNIVPVKALYGNTMVNYIGIEEILRRSPLSVPDGWQDASGKPADVSLPFPSEHVSGDIYFKRCSVGLVETQSIIFGDVSLSANATGTVSYQNLVGIDGDPDYTLLFYIDNRQQDDFRFFEVSGTDSTVTWSDRKDVVFDGSVKNVNIGFDASVEGTYEEPLYMFIVYNNGIDDPSFYYYGKITMHAIAVGEDERYRTLFTDFGLGDPKDYYEVFREYDGRESNVDYQLLNEKSKELFLSYDRIFPYVGTYKALLNAVKYLGYDDIYFKEWFRDVTDSSATRGTYVTYDVAYGSGKLRDTITSVPIERRLSYKKMNWLTMVYRINEETGESDRYGFPITKDVVDYDSDIIVRLMSLKRWLERYIISLNCRIIDITGEGIYFARYSLDAYPNSVYAFHWENILPVSPTIYNDAGKAELVDGSALLSFGFNEIGSHLTFWDLKDFSMDDLSDDKYIISSTGDVSSRGDDEEAYVSNVNNGNYIPFGGTALFPYDYRSVSFALNVSNKSILLAPPYCDVSLWINDDEIMFLPEYYGPSVPESVFSGDINLSIHVKSGSIRTFDGKWDRSIAYDIGYSDSSSDGGPTGYYIRSHTSPDVSVYMSDVPMLRAASGAGYSPCFRYTENNGYGIPLFLVRDFAVANSDASARGIFALNKDYILEISEGTIFFDNSIGKDSSFALVTTAINFGYDASAGKDSIDIYNRFVTKREPFSSIECTPAFAAEYLADPEGAVQYRDNAGSPFDISVFRTGIYEAFSYVYDDYNNLFCKEMDSSIMVYMKPPAVSIITRGRKANSSDFYDGSILYTNSGRTTICNIMNMFNDISIGNSLVDASAEDDGPAYMKEYMDLYYSAAFPIFRHKYLSGGLSFKRELISDDAVDDTHTSFAGTYMYASYPRMGYTSDVPVTGGYVDFVNITDRFEILSSTAETFTLKRKTHDYFNKFFDTGHSDASFGCNVVMYNRLLNGRVFESFAYIKDNGGDSYTIGFGDDNAALVNFRNLSRNANNLIYLQDISEFEMVLDSGMTDSYDDSDGDAVFDVSIKGLSSICGGKMPFEDGEMVRIRMVAGSYSGSASYKVKTFDYGRSILVLYGGFNYDASLDGAFLSHAHHAFVDYPALMDAVSVSGNLVEMNFSDDFDGNVFDAMDDTFSICPNDFDVDSAVSDWMQSDSSMFMINTDEIGEMGFLNADAGSKIKTTKYILPEIVQSYIERYIMHHAYIKWDEPYWFEDLSDEEQSGATESVLEKYPHIKPSLSAEDVSSYKAASNSDSIRTKYKMVEKDSFWPRYHEMDATSGLGEDYVYTEGGTTDTASYYTMRPLYTYYSPITVGSGTDIIMDVDFYKKDSSFDLDSSYLRLDGQKHVYWKMWKEDKESHSRQLRAELYNRYLFLSPKDAGIYDVDGYIYDDFGNLAIASCRGKLKVV